jgi:ABC-type multidrug transport system permease subunit
MISNIVVELPWNTLMSVLLFVCWYYPIGLYRNTEATDSTTLRGTQMWLFVWTFLMFASTFAHFMIAAFESAENAGNTGNLLFTLCLLFCGILATPEQLPDFWIFMYRISPFTYLVGGMLAVGVADSTVTCAANEYLRFDPLNGTCGEYMAAYQSFAGGYVEVPDATSNCAYCPMGNTNVFLTTVHAEYSDVWRNFGLMWVFIIFNVFAACGLYWWVRVPKRQKVETEEVPLRAPGSLDSENEVERKGTVAGQDKITKDAEKKAGLV